MTLFELQKLVSRGESLTLEFKKSTAQLRPSFETLCGFVNGIGGIVLIGITNEGKIVGQEVSDSTQKDIAQEIARLDPQSLLDIKYISVAEGSNLKVISLKVLPGQSGPYMYDGRAFQRVETTTVRMSQNLFKQMIIDRDRLENPWEKLFAQGYGIEDLDYEEIHRTVDFAIRAKRLPVGARQDNIKDILKNLELMEGDKIFNGAVTLFAKKIKLSYGQCGLRMARFLGTDKIRGFIDNKQIEGNVFFLLGEAESFLDRHLPIAGTFQPGKFERINTPALPLLALREALINMLCHRNYNFDTSTSSLAIYDDRVEIWNAGTLLEGITFEDLRKPHISTLRNKCIANVFYKRDLIEKWGSGTLKMIELCKNQDLPEPEFSKLGGGMEVVFKFKESIGPLQIENKAVSQTTKPSLTVRQEEIIKIILNLGKAPLKKILIHIKDPLSVRTIRNDLTVLRELGLLDSHGRGRHAVWFTKNSKI